jgi:hypothetical protein
LVRDFYPALDVIFDSGKPAGGARTRYRESVMQVRDIFIPRNCFRVIHAIHPKTRGAMDGNSGIRAKLDHQKTR